MADLADEQDEALKNTGRAKGGIGKGLSVVYLAYRRRRGNLGEDYCAFFFFYFLTRFPDQGLNSRP